MDVRAGRGFGAAAGLVRRWTPTAGLLGCCVTAGAWAQELPPPELADTGSPEGRPRIELAATALPSFDNVDGATHSSRIGMIWLPPRRPNLGLALGLTNRTGAGLRLPGAAGATAVDLGLHWRSAADGPYRIDITAWRRMTPPDAATLAHERQAAAYGARFEMQVKSLPSSGFVAEHGFLGLQLQSGARITVKRRHGAPMIYYRTKF